MPGETVENGMTEDRLPPHDHTAEQATLGCVLMDWQQAMPVCIQAIGEATDVFYDMRHSEIYRCMVEMYDAQEAIDSVTLSSWLSFQALLDGVGGITYLCELPNTAPSAANVGFYLDILLGKAKARRLIRICTEGVAGAYENEASPDDLIAKATADLISLSDQSITVNTESKISELIPAALDQIENWHNMQGVLTGIGTGFGDLDMMTTGFHAAEMIVIAGRPGHGKTSLAMNIAEHVAVDQHLPVGVFSMEMTKSSLVLRMICSRARVNVRNIRAGYLTEANMNTISASAGRLNTANIYINDEAGLSILGLRTRARRMFQQHGIRLLVIDYLQLMSAEKSKNDSREQEVSFISKGVKNLAKELGIPVIALSQLNRGMEKDKERRPRMSDLRESGSLENDADFVGILWNPERNEDDQESEDVIRVNLEICKQRNGPTGPVPLVFLREFTRFESAASPATIQHQAYQAPYADNQQEFPS